MINFKLMLMGWKCGKEAMICGMSENKDGVIVMPKKSDLTYKGEGKYNVCVTGWALGMKKGKGKRYEGEFWCIYAK